MSIGFWDVAFVLGVSLQCLVIAYLHTPLAKAAVFALPIPFTLACMAIAQPIGAFNAIGVPQSLVFIWIVYVLHNRCRVPIIFAIIAATVATALCAWMLARLVPPVNVIFWVAVAANIVVSVPLYHLTRPRDEPAHRTPLPIWAKLPAIIAIVCGIVAAKQVLHGLATVFPMVTIITCYEGRHSLWTLLRKTPIVMLTFAAMEVAIYLAQPHMPLPGALALGWVAYVATGLIIDVIHPGAFWPGGQTANAPAPASSPVIAPAAQTSDGTDAPRCDTSSPT